MSAHTYMSQLSATDRDFLLQLAYADDPPSHISTPVRPATTLPDSHSNPTVQRLKEELVEERGEVFRLQTECNSLREALNAVKMQAERTTQEQEKRIAVINERFKEVMAENLKFKRQITFSLKHYEENSAQATAAHESLATLRQLLLGMLDKENTRKKQDITQKRLLESLNGLLPDSEPPIDFPFSDENEFIRSNNGRLEVELRKKDEIIKQFSCRIEKLESENEKLVAGKREWKRNSEVEMEKVKRQLVGALRRVQYLVQEKEKTAGEKKELQEYCGKLEGKLLRLTGRKPGKVAVTETSEAVDLRVDRKRLMEALEEEEGSVDVSEDLLKRVHEAHWKK